MKPSLALWLLLLCTSIWGLGFYPANAYPWFYSPADSILYFQHYQGDLRGEITLRFRDGGNRVERAQAIVDQPIFTTDDIPGHLFAPADSLYDFMHSDDYGDTWNEVNGFHWLGWGEEGRPGNRPGESTVQVYNELSHNDWLFYTHDSWQTYDSTLVNRIADGHSDTLYCIYLTYETGVIYGMSRDTVLYVSSDFGQTWSRGSRPTPRYPYGIQPGGSGELWWWQNDSVFASLDTGRTMAYVMPFPGHLPSRPDWAPWMIEFHPTDHRGEVYFTAYIHDWLTAGEFVIYHVRDYGAEVDSTYYYLEDYWPEAVDHHNAVPKQFQFSTYPNPFNPTTKISFDLPKAQKIELKVFDVLGKEVAVLQEGMVAAGEHWVTFDGAELPSGVYFMRLEAGRMMQTKKMMLLK